MKSLEERHAEREQRRKEGPGPVVIEKDPETEQGPMVDEEEREPMRNKRPGSSKEQPGAEARVEGDDSIDSGFTFGLNDEQASQSSQASPTPRAAATPRAAKTTRAGEAGEAGGNGGGARDWTASKS